jgi:hypothetical protein
MHMLQQMSIFAMLSLVLALVPAAMGVSYAIRPTESKLALMRPLSLAGLFAGLSGFCIGVINSLMAAVMQPTPPMTATLLVGVAESVVSLAVAFGSLTLAWLMAALGLRRQVA